MSKWKFWIDCGGTFSDFVALCDDGHERSFKVHKVLSHSPHYESAVVKGMADILGYENFSDVVTEVRLGTTVATNAFLEKKGTPCALICTKGHKDLLEIRQQNRPDLFALDIKKVQPLYDSVWEIEERIDAKGAVVYELDEVDLKKTLKQIKKSGITSVAIAFMHSVINPEHEIRAAELADELGLSYISQSHKVSPKGHYTSRAETSVVDAYLSPFLAQYTKDLEKKLGIKSLFYMQSNGQLCTGDELKGHNALLSGPAGGLVGAIRSAVNRGHEKVITFDMGGTSTDVSLYSGEMSLDQEPLFHGLKLLAPMVDIHTVAAGGGSILNYDNGRFMVGPESAGAYPGPACYRNGGPLTVTDANLFLGRLEKEKFPKVFGPNQNQDLDENIVKEKFEELSQKTGLSPENVAQGFLDVAVESMARAVRKISVEKGYDPREFTLVSFGGAGGQLALKVAEALQMKTVFIHPLSSVLSAYGMGMADQSKSVSGPFDGGREELEKFFSEEEKKHLTQTISLGAVGSDYEVAVQADGFEEAKEKFRDHYERVFGVALKGKVKASSLTLTFSKAPDMRELELFGDEEVQKIEGFCVLSENKTAIVVEKGWSGQKNVFGEWDFTYCDEDKKDSSDRAAAIELEIFYQKFQFIAEGMGYVLKRLAHSVNIKERNDFSCALFTAEGELLANAPHIPVHLGSMGEAVKWVMKKAGGVSELKEGQSYLCNHPRYGGTHLPDLTLVTPIFHEGKLCLWLASRGHHADVGGISPGSMPGSSKKLSEEGIAIPPTLIVEDHKIKEKLLRTLFLDNDYPARNFELNLHDIKAKLAANIKGQNDLKELFEKFGVDKIKKNALALLEYSDKKISLILKDFKEGKVFKEVTKNRKIALQLTPTDKGMTFSFEGTSPCVESNFNAPKPIVKAAVLFSLRCLIDENIPLNDGLLRSIDLKIPKDSLLDPPEEAAVVAGNVETSQVLCDLVFQALGVKADSQGTMNNLTFGNGNFQYYETLAGGSGATKTSGGASGVQVNMTNSLLTDPEVLEMRFPVRVTSMKLREGSGGKGQHLGGEGIVRELEFLEKMNVSMLSQFRDQGPRGLEKGGPGAPGENLLVESGKVRALPECFDLDVPKGSCLIIKTPGGGGWSPLSEVK